jgi:hypothetical protein
MPHIEPSYERMHYTPHMRKGKRVMVAGISKGIKGAGRPAKGRILLAIVFYE